MIHNSAQIDNGASIGLNTNIWHWVHICSDAVIGNNCSLGQNVFVANKARIGNNVKIKIMFLFMIMLRWKIMSFVGLVWFSLMYTIQGLKFLVKMNT